MMRGVYVAALMAGPLGFLTAAAVDTPPQPGITVPYKITRVIDGDTLEGHIQIPLKVRLKDIYAPEPNEDGGKEVRDFVVCKALGKHAVLHVPGQDKTLGSSFSFDRAVGEVWIDGKRLGTMLVEEGLAKRTE